MIVMPASFSALSVMHVRPSVCERLPCLRRQPFTKELLSGRGERQLSRHESGGSSVAAASDTKEEPTGKRFKNIKYRTWTDAIQPPNKYRKPSDNELTQVGAERGWWENIAEVQFRQRDAGGWTVHKADSSDVYHV